MSLLRPSRLWPELRQIAPRSMDQTSRNNLNLSLPKGSFLPRRVQHGYLAVILAWRELVEGNAEAEGHCLQPIIQPGCDLHRLGFEGFCLLMIKTHKRHQGLSS